MYRSNRNFNTPLPRATPGHLTFLKTVVQIPPYPGQNAVQMPHTRVIKYSRPGDISIHRHINDRRTEETPSVVEQRLYNTANNSHSIYQKLRSTLSVFTTNKSLVQSGGNRFYKVTECSAFLRVSCNIESVL